MGNDDIYNGICIDCIKRAGCDYSTLSFTAKQMMGPLTHCSERETDKCLVPGDRIDHLFQMCNHIV